MENHVKNVTVAKLEVPIMKEWDFYDSLKF